MYHVSAQGVDERMINVHYYYYFNSSLDSLSNKNNNVHLLCAHQRPERSHDIY